jgi:hypothetical protein
MNITRIINLFRAHFIERKRMLLILSIIAFAVATLDSINGLLEQSVALFFIFLIVIAGMFFQSSLKRNNSVHFFNLPVTAGEKLVNAIVVLITLTIVFQIIMVAGAYTGYYLIRPAFNIEASGFIVDGISILKLNIWDSEGYVLFAAALSVFLFGSIYFKRMAFLKTLAIGAGFFIVIFLYNLLLISIAFGNSLGEYSFYDTRRVQMLHASFYEGFEYIIPIMITLFFLSITWLRLKETEV